MLTKEQIGLKIKEIRKSKKMTQEKLAEIIDVDFGYISKLEVGQNFPSIQTLNKISEALNVDIASFFTYTNLNETDIKYEIYKLVDTLPKEKLTYIYKFLKSIE